MLRTLSNQSLWWWWCTDDDVYQCFIVNEYVALMKIISTSEMKIKVKKQYLWWCRTGDVAHHIKNRNYYDDVRIMMCIRASVLTHRLWCTDNNHECICDDDDSNETVLLMMLHLWLCVPDRLKIYHDNALMMVRICVSVLILWLWRIDGNHQCVTDDDDGSNEILLMMILHRCFPRHIRSELIIMNYWWVSVHMCVFALLARPHPNLHS